MEVKNTELTLWKKIKKVASNGRRTGCGFTALGDCLAALGLKYDSNEGKQMLEVIMQTKMLGELDATIDLSILRGNFDNWDSNKEFKFKIPSKGVHEEVLGCNDFYDELYLNFPEQAMRMMQYGRRNISWSTVAPTGTVSLMCQTTSGLEPLFMPFYMRRKKVNPNDKDVRVDFTDQNGDNWQEFPILHPKFKDWMNKTWDYNEVMGNQTTKENLQLAFEKSPWYGSTANDIDWVERVKIQGIIQQYTSHSISSTINLPNDVTQEEVSKIYLASYDEGLKGVTIYRDGCRSGVLVSDTEKKESFTRHDAPKRPDVLDADSHIVTVRGDKFNILVGLFEGHPYEVFAFNGKNFNKGSGKLIKEKAGKYSYESDTVHSLDIANGMTDEQAALTRLISTSLRHGADIQYVVEQLQKTDGDITSFSKAIARTLKKYIAEEALLNRAKCQDCDSTNLRMEEGCVKCNDCGSSKCG